MHKKDWSSNDVKFTTIEISEDDKQKLFECAMKIKEMNGHKEPMLPYEICKFATEALVNEIEFFQKGGAGINNLKDIAEFTTDFRGRKFDADGNLIEDVEVSSKKLN